MLTFDLTDCRPDLSLLSARKLLPSTRLSPVLLLLLLVTLYSKIAIGNDISTKQAIQFSTVDTGQHPIHYAYSGDPSKPGLLFIHGTPGAWSAFRGYLANPQLQKDFYMVSVDRLGWGKSQLPSQKIKSDFASQSAAIGDVLALHPNKTWTLIGHSLGASIAPQIALDNPDQVGGLLLLAGSLKPSLGKPRWYNYAASTWLVSSLLSPEMKNSNREIMALKRQLAAMDLAIKDVKLATHVIVMQGKNDRLVSPKNPNYVVKEWAENFASIRLDELEDEGHFLPWRQANRIIERIYELSELLD